jgi:hypothetical protein
VAKAKSKTVTLDRRSEERREAAERRAQSEAVKDDRRQPERRKKVNRRRQIDPTTCERDYSTDEIEFMQALDEYKRTSGRMFPTCSEILEVLGAIGYVKQPVSDATDAKVETQPFETAEVAAEGASCELNGEESCLSDVDEDEDS